MEEEINTATLKDSEEGAGRCSQVEQERDEREEVTRGALGTGTVPLVLPGWPQSQALTRPGGLPGTARVFSRWGRSFPALPPDLVPRETAVASL